MADPMPQVPVKVPFDGITGTLDVEDVRHFIWDRTVEDNPLELDLAFSDEDIGWAFRHAAMMYNATMPPINLIRGPRDVTDLRLTYPFLIATIYHLFVAKAAQLSRQDIDYSAGNMEADFTKRRIEYLTKWAETFKEKSESGLKEYKLMINVNNGFACL